jgi:para-aminobenzoate synthetase/4-amino-4-deoxychorismate lyase
MQEWILFEDRHTLNHDLPGLFFQHPVDEVICWDPLHLFNSLQRLDALRHRGYYLVGFMSYEAGLCLQSCGLGAGVASNVPLLHFLVFGDCLRLTKEGVDEALNKRSLRNPSRNSGIQNLQLKMSLEEYRSAFNKIKAHIREGDTYQVNLTSKYVFDFQGCPVQLYQRLRERQNVAYSGVLMFKNHQLLTLSPELFFSKQGSRVCVRPMKGTVARVADPALDRQQKAWLSQDTKSIAENIMIVDLLRNDLSALSQPGSVKTTQLLHVESYETVHQMVSSVECIVDPNITLQQLMHCLFPCGSITGAPKRRTMEIISTVEQAPRGVYTGAIGYMMPNNDMCFNVGIRTIALQNGAGELGVGGGIVHDSEVSAEFQEMQLKGLFFTELGLSS